MKCLYTALKKTVCMIERGYMYTLRMLPWKWNWTGGASIYSDLLTMSVRKKKEKKEENGMYLTKW